MMQREHRSARLSTYVEGLYAESLVQEKFFSDKDNQCSAAANDYAQDKMGNISI